jgi:hypothetical protein
MTIRGGEKRKEKRRIKEKDKIGARIDAANAAAQKAWYTMVLAYSTHIRTHRFLRAPSALPVKVKGRKGVLQEKDTKRHCKSSAKRKTRGLFVCFCLNR